MTPDTDLCTICGSPFNTDLQHYQKFHTIIINQMPPELFCELLKTHLVFPNIEIDFG
jgi:hypothetical protein